MLHKDGYVYLEELSKNGDIYIKVSDKLRKKIKGLIIKKYNSLYNLEKISIGNFRPFLDENKKICLPTLFSLLKILNIDNKISKEIISVGTKTGKCIENPRLPFNFNSKEGFRIIGAIFGDGSISKKEIFSYFNYDLDLVKRVRKAVLIVLGEFDTKILYDGRGYRISFPSIIAKILLEGKMKKGDKTINNPFIPDFIMVGKKENKLEFLKQITDDEGSPQINYPYSYSVRYDFSVNSKRKKESNIIDGLRWIFIELDYNTTKIYNAKNYRVKSKKLNGYSWAFNVQGKNSLEKFQKEISFSVKSKNKKFLEGLKLLKRNQLGTKKMYETAIGSFREVYKKEYKVTKYSLAKEAKISIRNSQEWLYKLRRKNFIRVSKNSKYIHNGKSTKGFEGKSPAEYVIK